MSHTKSPKYMLFSHHQIPLLNNQNHLSNHQKYETITKQQIIAKLAIKNWVYDYDNA